MKKLVTDTSTGDLAAAVRGRLGEWDDTRAGKVADREVVQLEGAMARETFRRTNKKIEWRRIGGSCPVCAKLHGRVVGHSQSFVNKGGTVDPQDGVTMPLTVKTTVRHPRLHTGCKCMLVGR